jgi:hypothetical protein
MPQRRTGTVRRAHATLRELEREGLGSKLHGVGVYVRPVGVRNDAFTDQGMVEPDTVSPEGKPGRSKKFIAPFFYAQVWVLDAATLAVLETSERYDFQRLYDPDSTAIHIEDSFKYSPAEIENSSSNRARGRCAKPSAW